MKILIDLTSLDDNFSGIERFALSITKSLIKLDNDYSNQYILLFKNKIHEEFINLPSYVTVVVLKGKNKLLFNQIILPFNIYGIQADCYFFPAFPAPFFLFKNNQVNTIHDVGCWDSPSKNKWYMILYFKLMYKKAAIGSKKIVTVSEFSKRRIISVLNKSPNFIQVIYNGISDSFTNFRFENVQNKKSIKKYNLPSKYILCLSTLEPRKNLRLLVKAFNDLIIEKRIQIDLVLAGRKGWAMDDLLNGISEEAKKRIHFTGFISEESLPYVYKNASVFVFPSTYEGFGIPPIEAMSIGIPVITSDSSSLPEILGNAAFYFKNNNLDSLKNMIVHVLHLNEEDLNIMKKRGILRAKKYDWDSEAMKLMNTIFKNL